MGLAFPLRVMMGLQAHPSGLGIRQLNMMRSLFSSSMSNGNTSCVEVCLFWGLQGPPFCNQHGLPWSNLGVWMPEEELALRSARASTTSAIGSTMMSRHPPQKQIPNVPQSLNPNALRLSLGNWKTCCSIPHQTIVMAASSRMMHCNR